LDQSLREVAGTVTLSADEPISDEAVRKRLAHCAEFLEALVKELLHLQALPRLPCGWSIVVVDGTVISAPGSSEAECRIHLCIDLLSLHFVDLQVSDAKKGESLKNFELAPHQIVLGDRGYCSVSGILNTVQSATHLVVRWYLQTNLYESKTKERKINLVEKLNDLQPGESTCFS